MENFVVSETTAPVHQNQNTQDFKSEASFLTVHKQKQQNAGQAFPHSFIKANL